MRKLRIIFALMLVLLFPLTAPALSPEDALSARSVESFYTVLRIDDLNGLLKAVFSPENIEMATSFIPPDDADAVKMVAAFAAQIPANSVALSVGMASVSDDNQMPFFQVAAAMPSSVRAKLDKLSNGSASAVDIITLLLGDAGIMFAPAFSPEVHKGEKGTYYTIDIGEQVAFAAKDDMLLISLTPGGLEASLGALEDKESRLALNRRFESPNFLKIHMDVPAMMGLAKKFADEEMAGGMIGDPDEFSKIFKVPFDMEMDFSSKPESFLVSLASNAIEAIAPDFYSGIKPSKGAGMFLAGGGRLLAGLSGPLNINISQIKAIDPQFAQIWETVDKALEKIGLSASDAEDLINGTISFALGSSATIMGKRTPGGYIALTGRNGAAAKILGNLMENEDFTSHIPLAPLKADGWDSAFAAADFELFPVPLLIGSKGDTLFIGVVDSGDLGKTPEIPGEFAEMLNGPLIAAGAIDTAGIWNWVREEIADPDSLLPIGAAGLPEPIAEILKSVMEAELSVPLVKIWAPELETSFLEFKITDVPEEKRLLTRVMNTVRIFIPQRGGDLDDTEYEPDGDEEKYGDETDGTEEPIDGNEEDKEN